MVQATAPRIRQPKIIERPRLTKQLDECGARLILLIAPAGYGKTTLARQWLADKPHAWCALTPASRDVAALAFTIGRMTKTILENSGTRLERQLGLSPSPTHDSSLLANLLAEDLATWPANTWLAIDDYHSVGGSADCERFIEALLDATALRVIITSRLRPLWATSRARAYEAFFQMGLESLTMTDEEASQVVPDPKTRALAGGWPAVVGLAAALDRIETNTELGDSTALHTVASHCPGEFART